MCASEKGRPTAPALEVCKGSEQMQPLRLTDQFKTLFTLTLRMTETAGVDAILMLVDGAADWQRLRSLAGDNEVKIVAAADTTRQLAGAKEAGLDPVCLDMPDSPVYERLTQAVLEAVADDILGPRLVRGGAVQRFRLRDDRLARASSTSTSILTA